MKKPILTGFFYLIGLSYCDYLAIMSRINYAGKSNNYLRWDE